MFTVLVTDSTKHLVAQFQMKQAESEIKELQNQFSHAKKAQENKDVQFEKEKASIKETFSNEQRILE